MECDGAIIQFVLVKWSTVINESSRTALEGALRCDCTGVSNDSFEENPPYGLLNITRVSLRHLV